MYVVLSCSATLKDTVNCGELWQMQIDDEWIHYCNDPDREEDAAEALAANRLRRRGGLYQRDGRTPAVARQNRAAAVPQ